MELLTYNSFTIANPSRDAAGGPDPLPVIHAGRGAAEEALVVDARAGLSPAQMVERKLASLLNSQVSPLSHLRTSRGTRRTP